MTDKSISFLPQMVRAILAGTKTQTRRINQDCSYSLTDSPWRVGQVLWVRETFGTSRLTLDVIGVKTERVQDISDEDARAEGVDGVSSFVHLWNSIYAKRGLGWEANPYVWAITFKLLERKGL